MRLINKHKSNAVNVAIGLAKLVGGAILAFAVQTAHAVTDENFDALGLITSSGTSMNAGTWTFTSTVSVDIANADQNEFALNLNLDGSSSDRAIIVNYNLSPASHFGFKSIDGADFKLDSVKLGCSSLGSTAVVVSGWRNGVEVVSGEVVNLAASDSTGNIQYTLSGTNGAGSYGALTFGSAYSWVDEIHVDFASDSWLEVDDIDISAAVTLPVVSDSRISISGASGTGGAYKIGDTVTATWNNTASGDNNSGITGVTVDFSQFGGGSAVVATSSSNTWTATYTISAGSIDATNRNVSVTATNANGSSTRADSTNATVDNVAPTVTDGRISISGGSGIAGAYKIGDTVTASWNNTAAGDNNSDTISSVRVNFSQFGGGSAVSAINSSGTWTATYTIAAGAIDTTNRNVSVSATDNAGNVTTTSDSTNATVDNVAASVSSIAVSGSPTSGDMSIAFTVNFSESVSNVSTDDFTLVSTGSASGSISSVSASSGSSINVTISGITGTGTLKVNLNGSTNIADHAGNSVAAYSSGSTHTAAILTSPGAPTIGTATPGDSQASITFTAPGSNGGSAITTYTATASPGGAFGSCAGPAACTITVNGLSNGTTYTFTVTATNSIGTSVASGASNSATPKGDQTVTFGNPGTQNFGTTPTLTATATSSLTTTFSSSTTGVCTITSGGALTFVTAGSCTIDADQAGNSVWNAAATVTRTFTVNAVAPGAPTIGTATAGNTQATVTFTAPASSGGAAVTGYSVMSNPGGVVATGSSSPITVTGLTNGVPYTFTVTATNSAGTGSASAASNSVTPASAQTITFNNPGAQNFGTAPTLTATSDSGLTPMFTSATTGVCTVTSGGLLAFVSTGTCTINANQSGNSSFLAATQVSRSFTVNPIVPGVPTSVVATAGDTQASIAFTAPVSTGGSAITGYTVTVNPADVAPVSGATSPIVVTGLTNGQAYTFTVTADNAAGTGSASASSNSITPAAAQTITFANPGAQNFGTTPTLTATSDSGLTPAFTSSTTAVCAITGGGALTFLTAGTCTINANQAGNGSYLAAIQVTRSFTVNAVLPGAPTIGVASASNGGASVSFSAPLSTGGSAITSYRVTASPGGATAIGTGSPISFTGLSNGTTYTFNVQAINAVGTGPASATSNSITPKASQTITFTNPGDQIVGTVVALSATASGSTPSFSSSTPVTCSVSGSQATLLKVGTCTILAEASGTSAYESASASQSFAVKSEPNKIPVITQGTSTSVKVNEDTKVAFSLSATDANNEPLSWTIQTQPSHGTAEVGITGGTSYTPIANYEGADSFVVAVTDGKDTVTITVSVTVSPFNDAPTITGTPELVAHSDEAYNFAPVGRDVDKGDVLTYSITNKPSWASFNTSTGVLTGTPAQTDVGTITRDIVISLSDGTERASLPAFNLKVISANPALPVLKLPADLTINATALYTPVTVRQLLGIAPTSSQADVDKVLLELAVDSKGESCCTTLPEELTADQVLLLKPGVNVVKWTAKNAAGLTNSGVQLVNVNPLVSLSKSQIAVRGTDTDFKIILNGTAPVYPLTIAYVIDPATTATTAEYTLTSDSVTLMDGQLEASIPVSLKVVSGMGDSQLVVRLANDVNASPTSSHTISLREGNVPPIVTLRLTQGGFPTSLVTPDGGAVTVTAQVIDPNSKDTHSIDWSATAGLADTDSNPVDAQRVFSPVGLVGSQQVQVSVTDSAGAVVQAQLYFKIVNQLPVLSPSSDIDKDGLVDQLEGVGDSDSNGIPDYLDNMPATNILPQQIATTNAYLIECDPGVRCGLGLLALSGKSGGAQILDSEVGTLANIKPDSAFTPVGGIFDFIIRDLPVAGQNARVVIPQVAAVPANAIYRKYLKGQWVNFVIDQNNAVHSAPGNAGYCPPPGSSDWKTGLIAGSLCVQLTLQDGGPNDDDGKVNSAIADPGAVSSPVAVVNPPIDPPVTPPSNGGKKKGGAVDLLFCLLILGGLFINRFKLVKAAN